MNKFLFFFESNHKENLFDKRKRQVLSHQMNTNTMLKDGFYKRKRHQFQKQALRANSFRIRCLLPSYGNYNIEFVRQVIERLHASQLSDDEIEKRKRQTKIQK